MVHVAGLLTDLHVKIAHETLDLFDLAGRHQVDAGILQDRVHLRGQDAGRTVQCGKGLVELRHVAADRGIPFDQIDLLPRFGQFERGLDAGDAAADHQYVGVDVDEAGRQRLEEPCPIDGAVDQGLGLGGRLVLVLRHPGVLFADIDDGQQVLVQTGVLDHLAEGLLMHQRRTGGHDNPIQVVFPDIVLDHLLPRRGAHEFVIRGHDHLGQRCGKLGQFADPNGFGDVHPTVTDKNTDPAHKDSLSLKASARKRRRFPSNPSVRIPPCSRKRVPPHP